MNSVGIDVPKRKSMIAVMRPSGEEGVSPIENQHTDGELSLLRGLPRGSSVNKGTEISFSPLGLQTILFALSGSGSFIFALGGIEFIGYLEAEALEIPVNPIFHIGIYAV